MAIRRSARRSRCFLPGFRLWFRNSTQDFNEQLRDRAEHTLFQDDEDDPLLRRWKVNRQRLDREALNTAIGPSTRAIVFNNPHNPTGRLFDEDELDALAAVAQAAARGVPLTEVCATVAVEIDDDAERQGFLREIQPPQERIMEPGFLFRCLQDATCRPVAYPPMRAVGHARIIALPGDHLKSIMYGPLINKRAALPL